MIGRTLLTLSSRGLAVMLQAPIETGMALVPHGEVGLVFAEPP
jgi:hypothetical protein